MSKLRSSIDAWYAIRFVWTLFGMRCTASCEMMSNNLFWIVQPFTAHAHVFERGAFDDEDEDLRSFKLFLGPLHKYAPHARKARLDIPHGQQSTRHSQLPEGMHDSHIDHDVP